MALSRGLGAYDDGTAAVPGVGTSPLDVRKALSGLFASTGVLPGAPSVLVQGTTEFTYSVVGPAQFVTSRGPSDGHQLFANDGAATVVIKNEAGVVQSGAPGSGLSRIDVIWVRHPTNSENGDTSSQPIFGATSGLSASSSPAAPSIPTGALELARNTMTSAAVSTRTVPGNTFAQTAAVAYLRDSTPKAKTDNSGWSSVSSDAGGNITIAHGLGAKPVAFFANITATGTTALVQQLGKVIAGGSDATNISFTTIRSDTGAVLVGTIGFYWFATL